MKSRTFVITLLFTLCLLTGCSSTKALFWKASDVSFNNYESFEIRPVFNASEKPFTQESLSYLTLQLKNQFQNQDLPLTDSPQIKTKVLAVQVDILEYEPNKVLTGFSFSSRKARCQLRTHLINKETNQLLAEITTVTEVGVEIIGIDTHNWILKKSAAVVAQEVVKMVRQPIDSK